MPAYSFSKEEFVPMILDRRKPHTIRGRRKNATKAGDVLTLYYKQRTKECRAIALTVCKKVEPVVIWPKMALVKVNGRMLAPLAASKLARADGFNSQISFFQFFQQYGEEMLDDFVLISWDTRKLIDLWHVDYFQALVKELSPRARLAWLEDQAGG